MDWTAFIKFVTELSPAWISAILSCIALTISILTYNKSKPRIKVQFIKNFDIIPDKAVYFINDNHELYTFGSGLHFAIEFINYGPTDISYFHMNVIENKENSNAFNNNVNLLTQASVASSYNGNKNMAIITPAHTHPLQLPPDTSGVISAHSYKRFDMIITHIPKEEAKSITFTVQISQSPTNMEKIRKWFAVKTKRTTNSIWEEDYQEFKEFNIKIDVSNFYELLSETESISKKHIESVLENVLKYETPFDTGHP